MYQELLIIGTGSIDGNKPFVIKLFSEILTHAVGNVLNKFTTVFRRTVLFSCNITTFIGLTFYQTDIWHKAIVSTCFLKKLNKSSYNSSTLNKPQIHILLTNICLHLYNLFSKYYSFERILPFQDVPLQINISFSGERSKYFTSSLL